jgi:hypothetical protein
MSEPYDGVFQVVFHPAMRTALERWIEGRGFYLFPMPVGDEDDLPTFGIGIGGQLLAEYRAAQHLTKEES